MDLNCKKIPLWLKTGVLLPMILFTLFLIIVLIMSLLFGYHSIEKYPPESFFACFGFFVLPGILLISILHPFGFPWEIEIFGSNKMHLILVLLISFILWFILGALIGFAWEKIKSKK